MKTHRERCLAESTRDVIFLLQTRSKVEASRQLDRWRTESVWIDRMEAQTYALNNEHNYGGIGSHHLRWHVYGIPAEGMLAGLLRSDLVISTPSVKER